MFITALRSSWYPSIAVGGRGGGAILASCNMFITALRSSNCTLKRFMWPLLGKNNRAMSSTAEPKDTFLYFGYGSNLCTERIHLRNPSAVKKTIAKLKDYKLDFNFRSRRWKGSVATIEPLQGEHVWGVVWELDKEHLASLDEQEGVSDGVYTPLELVLTTPEDEQLICRSYKLITLDNPDHRPSATYKGVILKGAKENGLPDYYIEKLEQIEDNGVDLGPEFYQEIVQPDPPMK